MAGMHMKLICSTAIIAGILAFLITDVGAKTNFARNGEKAVAEKSAKQAAEIEAEPCTNSPACCPTAANSLPKRTGSPISHILAFGCKLNYGLTNWILSDKCDIGPTPHNCP